MKKKMLIGVLNKATDKAAQLSIQRGFPIPISSKATLIGKLLVEKNKKGNFDIIAPNKTILYENISTFDTAMIIAQKYNSDEHKIVEELLALEKKFSKFHIDMIHYLHCMKSAKKKGQDQKLLILEDRFQMAELNAKNVKDQIAIFKRLK
jgi:hypothetical protein